MVALVDRGMVLSSLQEHRKKNRSWHGQKPEIFTILSVVAQEEEGRRASKRKEGSRCEISASWGGQRIPITIRGLPIVILAGQ